MNDLSYAYHYRNLDSTEYYARQALKHSDGYDAGYAEACNNLAFTAIAKMQYSKAKEWLDKIANTSDNQIELLVADVQQMRLCQRQSHNKDFYSYQEKASLRLRRIGEEVENLPPREKRRVLYAHSEFDIVVATYFYYVGLDEPMMKALNDIDTEELEQDTAQYLNYLYNIGAGGVIQGTANRVNQTEFDYLIQCYMLAMQGTGYPYWQANSLQAISEHLQSPSIRNFLIKNNLPAITYLNTEQMPDSLLAGNLAQRALMLFMEYGDVYQTAGGYRTLAECYWTINDYYSAADCLHRALQVSKNINSVPELVASIRERLSLVYSAIDDKPQSDYNRNIYLDLQEQTRQDRQLEARAAQLDSSSTQLNWMITAVIAMIGVVLLLLYLFDRMRRKEDQKRSLSTLLEPLKEWKEINQHTLDKLEERKEEIDEEYTITLRHIQENKRRNLEQRAKVSLVNSIIPFIDRMVHEVERLAKGNEPANIKQERYLYISELTDKINQYNQVLTEWIQMRQGALNLHIESFSLQPLFDIVQKGKLGFSQKGITLDIKSTEAVVKADRPLTLFMINTIADNARKFTPEGGRVTVSATEMPQYVEISIEDTGNGMDAEQLAHVFDRTYTGGHGFGLLNCKGIIEQYKKVSSIFQICDIHVESKIGIGSKFTFRLPKGIRRMLMLILTTIFATFGADSTMFAASKPSQTHHQHNDSTTRTTENLAKADAFADSAYFSNINAEYARTLEFADSSRYYLNLHYLSLYPQGTALMQRDHKESEPAELKWLHDSVQTNYDVILDIRNESAIAALALHKWNLYQSNNQIYTQLFRERSADNTLPDYVRTMQISENSKNVAIIILVLLFIQLVPAYYFLYYRHVLSYRFAVEKINGINKILLTDITDEKKLEHIDKLWNKRESTANSHPQLNMIVLQIEEALHRSINFAHNEKQSIELAEDELHRAEYENGKLHVSNSVLDNCLSTLKHETMYYPSRIRQLIDNDSEDVQSLQELVDYYKTLYKMLSAQAMQQTESYMHYDKNMLSYLFDIIKKEMEVVGDLQINQQDKNKNYTIYRIFLPKTNFSQQECRDLFTPQTTHLQLLICRQIVREIGEISGLRGCGIMAEKIENQVVIEIVLPKNDKIMSA